MISSTRKRALVRLDVALQVYRSRMTQALPKLFGDMRRKRRDEDGQRLRRRSAGPASRASRADAFVIDIDQLVELGDRSVVVKAPRERLVDRRLGCEVYCANQLSLRRGFGCRQAFARRRRHAVAKNGSQARQMRLRSRTRPLMPSVGPVAGLFGRRNVEQEEPHRVYADVLGGLVDADDVTARLRHLLTVVQHHALMEEMFERLVAAAHPAAIVKELVEEARVKQMQNGVLGAADILIDVHPLCGSLRRPRCASLCGSR